eukprot:TRINITY_DN32583_c0_g1_i1.p1 TRINITY_DN32583_c0_g1~~TRINITY_DN32583_c0_g1_i1.p1  ORF type:complete len:715 (+),score=333.63 TRINITY_DN32583_c0_g1_i1:57-2201(+)
MTADAAGTGPAADASPSRSVRGGKNLDTVDLSVPQGGGPLLDSPRSLEVCARNGFSVSSFHFRPFREFLRESQGDREIARRRQRHWKQRRTERLELLRAERRALIELRGDEPLPQRGGTFALTAPPTGGAAPAKAAPRAASTQPRVPASPGSTLSAKSPGSVAVVSHAAERRREEATARLLLERDKLRRQVEQARSRQAVLLREDEQTMAAMQERDRRLREQQLQREREQAKEVLDAQQREREQRQRQQDFQEARQRRREEERIRHEQLNAGYRQQEEERLAKLAAAQATREQQQHERRAQNMQKQQQIQSMVLMLGERRAAEMARRQEKAEQIRKEFDLQRDKELRARKAQAESRQRELRQRLERAREKEAALVAKSEEKARMAAERLEVHLQQKQEHHQLRRLQEVEKETKRREHFDHARRLEEGRRDAVLAKQQKDAETQARIQEQREHTLKLRKVEKELSIQDRLDAVERMRLIRDYRTEQQLERIAEKEYRVAEMERQEQHLRRERQKHREECWRRKVVRRHLSPGPGEYLGLDRAPETGGHHTAAAVFGGAIRAEGDEGVGPGPGAYAARMSVVGVHRGTPQLGPPREASPKRIRKKARTGGGSGAGDDSGGGDSDGGEARSQAAQQREGQPSPGPALEQQQNGAEEREEEGDRGHDEQRRGEHPDSPDSQPAAPGTEPDAAPESESAAVDAAPADRPASAEETPVSE